MKVSTLSDLFVDQLQEVYSGEKQIIQAMPKMSQTISDPQLQHLLGEYVERSRMQRKRLDRIFELLGSKPGRRRSLTFQVLLQTEQESLNSASKEVLYTWFIFVIRRLQDLQVSCYDSLVSLAWKVGNRPAAGLLEETLAEEDDLAFRLMTMLQGGPAVSRESELLSKIKAPLPSRVRNRYEYLLVRRDEETLSPDEHDELLRLTDRVEQLEARRLAALIELARLRRTSVDTISQELAEAPIADT